MGTHPIFESDFDCLTEMSGKLYTYPDNFRPTRSALSPTSLATSSTSPPNTPTVSPIRHLNFKLNSSERFQLSNLVTLPCVMTPQSPISLVMLKPVVANDPLMSFAGLDSLKTPFCHLLPNGSGQHSPLFNQTRLI